MQPEYLIERGKLRRQLSNWKIIAVLLLAAVLTFFLKFFDTDKGFPTASSAPLQSDYIASVYLDGIIMDDKKRDESLGKIVENSKIKAVILYVNSPGGGVTASEEVYSLLRKIAEKKPLVVVMNSLAASGGYMVSVAADYIVAHNSTITGSIGVIWQNAEITNLAEKLGITFNNFKSSPLKAAPNPMEKVTPEVEEAAMAVIKDSYDYFVDVVATRRKLPKDRVTQLADGRVYTGRQAFELKLVDRLGGTSEALQWLRETKSVDTNLKVFEFELKPKTLLQKILGDDMEQRIYNMFFASSRGLFASF
jgi:protease-4